MQPAHRYLSNLTPLRGMAAVWVAVFHFQGVAVPFVSSGSTHLIDKGYIMVDLFFIMSGFIICHVYRKSFEEGLTAKNFKRFIIARFGGSVYCLIYLILLVGVSSLTYYGVEKPCRKYINQKWGKETMPVYA